VARKPRRKAEETREDILTVAEDLLRTKGFSSVTMADIAAALQMSPANVFKHFHSKAVLVDAISARHLDRLAHRFTAINSDQPAPLRLFDLAQRLMEAHLDDLQQNPFLFEMIVMTAKADFPSGQRYRQMIVAGFAEIIRDGIARGDYHCGNPEDAALTVSDGLACILHPVLLGRTDCVTLRERCKNIVTLINAALQNPLVK